LKEKEEEIDQKRRGWPTQNGWEKGEEEEEEEK
jgi:hypothetical protein